jgi:hypothetical protein
MSGVWGSNPERVAIPAPVAEAFARKSSENLKVRRQQKLRNSVENKGDSYELV